MVLRHFTSHQDVVQDETVDTPHAHLASDGPKTRQSGTVWLHVNFMLKHCAYDRMTRDLPRDQAHYLSQESPIPRLVTQKATRLAEVC